jgi:hypothetical protein
MKIHPLKYCLPLFLLCTGISLAQLPKKKVNLTKKDRAEWFKILKWPQKCEESYQIAFKDTPSRYGDIEFHQISKGVYIVALLCDGGAYQPVTIFMLYREGNPSSSKLLKLKGFDSTDDHGNPLNYSEVNGLCIFHKKTKELEVLSLHRGTGDCGLWVKYKFQQAEGPVVVSAREKSCGKGGNKSTTNPHRWPLKRL